MNRDITRDEEPWPSYALPRGTAVNGYVIERVLGSGGFGITYLAYDLLRQPFAIKEYYPREFAIRQNLNVLAGPSEDVRLFEEFRARFMREAQALVMLGRVAGPGDGIVHVHTYFEAHSTCFLVMDYIKGASLASVLRQEPGGLSAARVRSLLSQLLSSIRIVHQAGLMHRDIKPANIIVREDDSIVLIDFGSSRPVPRNDLTSYTQLYSGGYAPPEQALGLAQGEYSDIYAIGAVCYRAIGGKVVDALARHNALLTGNADPQPSAAQIGAGRYPGPLLAAIDAALAIDPARRPQSVDATMAVLGQDESTEARTVIMPRHSALSARVRRRGVASLAVGAGALALGGMAYLLLEAPAAPPAGHRQAVVASMPADGPTPHVVSLQEQLPVTQSTAPDEAAERPIAVDEQPGTALLASGSLALQSSAPEPVAVAPVATPPPEAPVEPQVATPPLSEPTDPPPAQVATATPIDVPATGDALPLVAIPPGMTNPEPFRFQSPPQPATPRPAPYRRAPFCKIPHFTGMETGAGGYASIQVVNTGDRCGAQLPNDVGSKQPYRSLSLSKPPGHGSVVLEKSAFYYTPSPGFAGSDEFVIVSIPWGHVRAVVTVLPPEKPQRLSR